MPDLRKRPWLDEPNELDWESSGYPCFLRRGGLGVWCGYVAVPADHPWSGLARDARVEGAHEDIETSAVLDLFLEALTQQTTTNQVKRMFTEPRMPISLALHAHGGVTWAGRVHDLLAPNLEKLPNDWAFGFDCCHAGDVFPEMYDRYRDSMVFADSVYRDMDYAMGVASRMAAQLRIVHCRGTP